MGPIRKLLLVTVGVLSLYGFSACTSETELNPQPLPPRDGDPAPPPGPAGDEKTSAPGARPT